jgi:L-threonylcarbamoyladenylate synthase
MEIRRVDAQEPAAAVLDEAAEVLRGGGIVALPTETFYALAVDALAPEALSRVNRLKAKPAGAPILLLVADGVQLTDVAEETGRLVQALAREFWPGPLTLVLRARAGLPSEISPGRDTVAVRVPGLALPRRLARKLGRPISGISANRHGEPPCRTAAEVARLFPGEVALVLDGGPTSGTVPSTLLDLSGPLPRILREGAVPSALLERFLP